MGRALTTLLPVGGPAETVSAVVSGPAVPIAPGRPAEVGRLVPTVAEVRVVPAVIARVVRVGVAIAGVVLEAESAAVRTAVAQIAMELHASKG